MDLQKALETVKRIPGFGAAAAEETEELVGGRRAEGAELECVEPDCIAALAAPLEDVASYERQVEETTRALAEANHSLNSARYVVQVIRHEADTAQARIAETLRAGAHPGVAKFLDELADVWPRERLRWESDALKRKDGARMSAQERIDQINGARARAERLYYEPDPEVASAELERLRDAVALPTEAVA